MQQLTEGVRRALREEQEAHPELGPLFKALYAFAERTTLKFDLRPMPTPIIRFEKLKRGRKAEYRPSDGTGLAHIILIDPFKVLNGIEMVEYLAHELVHVWQVYHSRGGAIEDNLHDDQFVEIMADMGIAVPGTGGIHQGYIGDVWEQWIEENLDLELHRFLMPQTKTEGRKLHKYVCSHCDFSFRTRRENRLVFCEGENTVESLETHPPTKMMMVE